MYTHRLRYPISVEGILVLYELPNRQDPLEEVGSPQDSTTDTELFKTFNRNKGRAMESAPVPFLPTLFLDFVIMGQCR